MELLREALTNVKNYLQLASVMDVIDVVIVAFIIYKIMVLVRKSTAAQVLKGIGFIIALLGISALVGLNVLNFILSATMQVGVVAVLIMFQPELRKMLEQVGGSGITRLFNKSALPGEGMESVIAQTVSACNTLSQQKIGVLLVFERQVLLNDIIKTGTMIDAEVSGMLIKNIFFPKAALHDGAAIVRNGRIIAAGCMLPLTSNNNLSRDLGMRHRAGVGVSEVGDAIVVVVSEETGSISVATGGMLKRHLSSETLTALLKNELIAKEETDTKKGFGFLKAFFRSKKTDKDK